MKLKLILFICSFATLISCEKDILNKVPLDNPSSETFFSNKTELDLALSGAYRSLYWHSSRVPYVLWLDASTDIAWSRGDFGNVLTIQGGQFTSNSSVFYDIWTHMYKSIGRANNILDNMMRSTDVVTHEYYLDVMAQARFLRAYFYIYLINLYGDVPWVAEVLTLENSNLPRSTKEEVLHHIYEDLDFAAENLPLNRPAAEIGKATKGAALTLKARAALLQNDYQTALEASKEVIDLDIYEIYPSYRDLFQFEGVDSKESILTQHYDINVFTTQIPRYLTSRESAGYSVLIPTQAIVDMYACIDGLPIDKSPLFDPSEPFENRDPRLNQSIYVPGDWINNLWFQTHPDSVQTYKQTDGVTKRVANPEVTNEYATFTGYLWKKYLDERDVPSNNTQSTLPVMIMRYSEVLLTYAEAKIELNQLDQSVLDAINMIRQRESVQMPLVKMSTQEELRKTVRYERTIELALEGFRLFDIRRWRIAEHVMPGNVLGRRHKASWYKEIVPKIDDNWHAIYPNENEIFQIISVNQFDKSKHYLWPIPLKELDVVSELKQNPGYN